MVLRYPPIHSNLKNGKLLRAFSTVADIAPTILELAGIKHPVPTGQATGPWKDHTVAALRGKSWVPYFKSGHDGMEMIHTNDDPAYGWELFGRAALRKGKYKILHVGPAAGGREDGKWQLYNMDADPGEIHDLSEKNPEIMKELLADWEVYVQQTGTVWGPDAPPMRSQDFQAPRPAATDKGQKDVKGVIGGE